MNLSRLCKGVKPYCKKIKSQTAFVKELFKAAGNGYISDSYAKQLYSGGKPFTNELKAGFGSTDRTQELIAFFEGNITDAAGVLVDFGIPEKIDCDKKALCVSLTRQMQKLINGTDDVDDILAMTYEAEKTNTMIPRTSDGQLLFLLNNVSKMKTDTPLGSRIAEVHNASSLFTGDAGSGESNARRFLFESDLVEAIIALPENMFYNTKLATYIWVLSNKKEPRRVGKVQLIDASSFKSPLKRNMGKKNCELTSELRNKIVELFLSMEENEHSHIVSNSEFGYWKLTVQQPQIDEHGNVTLLKSV